MGLLDRVKIAMGYERKSHTYDSTRIPEGHVKMISKNELIKNTEKGLDYCKKDGIGNVNISLSRKKDKLDFKIIKNLNEEHLTEFSTFFPSGCPVYVKVNEIPKFLTLSEELKRMTLSVIASSGAINGMGLEIYRNAPDDALKGFPVNRDVYKISGSLLLKAKLPFENHWLRSIPILLGE